MNILAAMYRPSLALLTDLYELTMAYGYWKAGLGDREAVFHLTFRENPFGGGYTVACGLEHGDRVPRAAPLRAGRPRLPGRSPGRRRRPLFERAFLDFLGRLPPACDIDAVPEGTVVFPQEPLVRVTRPADPEPVDGNGLVEHHQLPDADRHQGGADRRWRPQGEPVLEFGLRRAQGIDGALSASRAAYVGGCAATSNVLAGQLFGIPVKGTHAHSWVMCFDDELAAVREPTPR